MTIDNVELIFPIVVTIMGGTFLIFNIALLIPVLILVSNTLVKTVLTTILLGLGVFWLLLIVYAQKSVNNNRG